MPPLPPAADVLEVLLRYTYGGDTDVINRFFVQFTGTAPTDAQLATMAASVHTAWTDTLKVGTQNSCALKEVVVTDLTSDTAARGLWTGSEAGSLSGDPLTGGSCVLLNFSVSRRYRGGKPRLYLPMGDGTVLDSPTAFASTFTDGVESQWDTFIGDVITAAEVWADTAAQVNVSYYSGFTAVENPITGRYRNVPTLRATPVVDAIIARSASSRPASQRRRN